MPRKFIPKVGDRVKLRLWEHYSNLDEASTSWHARFRKTSDECCASVDKGLITLEQSETIKEELEKQYAEYCKTHDVPGTWAWFEVLVAQEPGSDIVPELVKLRHVNRALSAPDSAWEGWVELDWINAPLGWKPEYEIICQNAEQAAKVIKSWFVRGIRVWTNHDMSSSNVGGTAFTPIDNLGSPHWQYTGNPTETILADDCPRLFTVKWLEEWEPKLPSTEQKAARRKAIEVLKKDTTLEFRFAKFGRGKIPYCRREHLVYKPV